MPLQKCSYRGSKNSGRHDQPVQHGQGRPKLWESAQEKKNHYRRKKHEFEKLVERENRYTRIAILDFETDPFDNISQDIVKPFAACLHRADHDDIIIWEENSEIFCEKVVAVIESLPGSYVIYAHNGGKFDYLFLIHKLRGEVKFKGRGVMEAQIGSHVLRDSFHLIPEKLASYHKENIDYANMKKGKRSKYKDQIISYMQSDCKYLFEIVSHFAFEHGFKLSIGQAAMSLLRKSYNVKRIGEYCDEQLRPYYFGGRVECLQGKGLFTGEYKLYDVNSMYPYVMSEYVHPIGNNYTVRRGLPNASTCFVNINCTNYGAFVRRDETGGCSADAAEGNFLVTRHEYDAAIELRLAEHIDIHWCVDCDEFTSFEKFITPLYSQRQKTKELLRTLPKNTKDWLEIKKDDLFLKLLMNNSYGKFAQNPRRYYESYITDCNKRPDEGDWGALPKFENGIYAIWERPSYPWRFNNVGTGASITGAARSVLLRAICGSTDPIYCDTDSLVCRSLGEDVKCHSSDLGAWDIEAEFSEVAIAGKKTYAAKYKDSDAVKLRSKGVQFDVDTGWRDMLSIIAGSELNITAFGPTLSRRGTQSYMTRNIKATAPDKVARVLRR